MYRPLPVLLFVLAACMARSQPSWQWAQALGGHAFATTDHLVADSLDGCTASGFFGQDLFLPWDTLHVNDGSEDGYIAHFDHDGTLVWALRSSTPILALEARSGGGVHALLRCTGTCAIGDQVITPTLPGTALVRAEVDGSGTLLNTHVIAGALHFFGIGELTAAALDHNGAVAVCGLFSDPVIIGDTTLLGPWSSGFAARFGPDGQLTWAQQLGPMVQGPAHIALAGNADTWLCAELSDAFSSSGNLLGTHGCVLAHFGAAGELVWHYNSPGSDLTPDTGPFLRPLATGTVLFGYNAFGGPTAHNLRLVLFDGAGVEQWSSWAYGATSFGEGADCVLGREGDALVSGYAVGGMEFGWGPIANGGGPDCFIAHANNTGAWDWATADNGQGNVYGSCTAQGVDGRIYVAGHFEMYARFGALPGFGSVGAFTGFVACLGPSSVNITEVAQDPQLRMWPVPARDRLLVQLSAPSTALRVLDSAGREVQRVAVGTATVDLDVHHLRPGLYVVSDGIRCARFLKE